MDYADEILEETPQRAAKLLNGRGALPTVRTLLAKAGTTDDDRLEGRTLLLDCRAAPRAASAPADTDAAKAERARAARLLRSPAWSHAITIASAAKLDPRRKALTLGNSSSEPRRLAISG